MQFSYVGYAEDHKIVRGTISAPSEGVAGQVLARNGYRVLDIKPTISFLPSWEKLFPSLVKTKPETVVMFSRQLALLLESGTDIVTALELLQAQASNRNLDNVLGRIIADLRNGEHLSTAMAKHPTVFPKMYVQSLLVGEQSGGLETVLRQIADYMEKETKAAKSIKGAMRYPIIVGVIAVIVIAVMIMFVFPAFASLYATLGTELPLPTKIVMSSVQALSQYGLYGIGAILLIVVAIMAYVKTPGGKLQWDGVVLKTPVLGRVAHLSELARCCRSISILFRAGLPLPRIMSLVSEGSNNLVVKNALDRVRQAMLKGEGLAAPMSRDMLFLPMMVQMVRVGQATGNLDVTLASVAECYETEAEDKMKSFVAMLQPAITLFVGGVVGLIAISLISAMYSIYGQVS
ncbi:MAG: type II secretion system F family protein [Chloroflexi bacterium]|nr:type II secretion system F family protein [Chloroflexota bacterium]